MPKKSVTEQTLARNKDIGSRLRQVRDHFGYSQDKMSEIMGIKKVTYSKNERGLHLPTSEGLLDLHRRLGISVEWLLFGCGPMWWEELQDKKKKRDEIDALSPELREMIALMGRVPMMNHSVMLHFQQFKAANQELIRAHLAEAGEDTDS